MMFYKSKNTASPGITVPVSKSTVGPKTSIQFLYLEGTFTQKGIKGSGQEALLYISVKPNTQTSPLPG